MGKRPATDTPAVSLRPTRSPVLPPADHLPTPEAIAAGYPVRLEEVKVVSSIRDWCITHELEGSCSFRMGKTARENGTDEALIPRVHEITPATQSSVIGGMSARGHFDAAHRAVRSCGCTRTLAVAGDRAAPTAETRRARHVDRGAIRRTASTHRAGRPIARR